MNVQVAIDFTGSNGDPRSPTSLHYLNPSTKTNNYTEAINSVVSILQDYDDDNMFPVYGFGGVPPLSPGGKPSHCFALNGNILAPECN